MHMGTRAADEDGDGLGDLVCGDQNAEGGENFTGTVAARVFLGSNAITAARTFGADADLLITPSSDADRPGAGVAIVRDFDGNDYPELLIGTPDVDLVTGSNGQPTSAPGAVHLLDLSAD